jgi:histidine triad (HIT) family protein
MTKCVFCEMLDTKQGVIYEDESMAALLHPVPATIGHVVVLPKKHVSIFEQVPDFVVGDLFKKVKKIASGVFETIKCEGTNVIVQTGPAAGQKFAHAMVHVIPRFQGDNLNLAWKPRQVSEDDMSTAEIKLREAVKNVGAFETPKEKPVKVDEPQEVKDDYLTRSLDRIP